VDLRFNCITCNCDQYLKRRKKSNRNLVVFSPQSLVSVTELMQSKQGDYQNKCKTLSPI